MKKIFYISLWLIVLGGITVLLGFAIIEHKSVKCSGMNISVAHADKPGFINEKDISKIIFQNFDSLRGKCIDSINTGIIESVLVSNPYISKADVFKSVTGKIRIDVERHEPLVRIISNSGENFYLSREGYVLPANATFTPRVMVASGYIDEKYGAVKELNYGFYGENPEELPVLSAIHFLAAELENHNYLDKYIEQIFINKEGEIELVPADGDHYIIIGDVQDLQKKFRNLMAFYGAGKLKVNDGFESLNLKFKNQVVCKK